MALKRIEVVNYNRQGAVHRGVHRQASIAGHAQYITGHKEASVGEHAAHVIRQRMAESLSSREDLVRWGAVNMPAWCQDDPLRYWREADRYALRKNTHLGKELVVTLPKEFTRDQNQTLIDAFLQQMPAGHPLIWAFHEKLARNRQHLQPHVHILISPRVNTGTHLDPAQFFLPATEGGAPSQKPWAMPAEVQGLHRQWEQLLRQHLRPHGLEHTLARHHPEKEVRLSWQEMQQLKRLLLHEAPLAWGHEYRLRPEIIVQWHAAGDITERQAQFLTQRGGRQLAYQHQQMQERLWVATGQLDQARSWQVVTRVKAARTQRHAEQTLQALTHRQEQLQPLRAQYVAPALARAAAQQQARRAWRQSQHPAQTPGGGLRVKIAGLDEVVQQVQRQQRQGQGMGL